MRERAPVNGALSAADISRERCILGAIYGADSEELPPNLQRVLELAPDSINDPELGQIAAAILAVRQRSEGDPVNSITVGELLHGDTLLTLASVQDEAESPLPLALADIEAEKLLAALPAELLAKKPVLPKPKVDIPALLASRQFDFAKEPAPLRAVYTLAGSVIATPGNLATISSAVKTGKSAVIGAMVASAMAEPGGDQDLLGFLSSNPEGLALDWFDSEQAPDDFWHCVARAIKRAGLVSPPPWLHAYCLTGLGSKRGWECVVEAVRANADKHGGAHSILLDGAADFVIDVNDSAESNAYVAELHDMAITYACPIIGVIHLNPGSEKSRGHLGSQLERKAETNLRLDKDDGVTTIWSEKQRRAPIPKENGPCFAWSDERGMHVSVQTRRDAGRNKKRESLIPIVEDVFGDRSSMRYTDIVLAIKTVRRCSDRWAEKKADELISLNLIKKSVAALYVKAI